jgi:hypothetical protein
VLNPLLWLAGLLMVPLALCIRTGKAEPRELVILLAALFTLTLLLILATYIYFGLRDPDVLRSESYSLGRMAIERGALGDSRAGTLLINKNAPGTQEAASNTEVQRLTSDT